ncbi:MAG: NADPH-dependent F420 reductase [Anaerolineae bacterium]|nr:NADPH-dependent F420 reductase [Anaerolineae bacterium]
MNIGIIGTGKMGSGLAKLWAGKGHKVLLGSRHPQTKQALASAIGPGARVGTIAEAAQFGDVLLFAVAWAGAKNTIQAAGSLAGKILIDCTNTEIAGGISAAVGYTTSGAEEIARWANGAKVVKAFNYIYASIIHSSPQFGSQNATVFYCGDDDAAKGTVAGLIGEIGFEPVDVGPLQNARHLEALAELVAYIARRAGSGATQAIKLVRR